MEKLQELEQKLQEYQQKINELTAQISQIKAEKENEIQSIIIGKDQTLAKLNELIGGETKRPDTLKGLVQYDIGENDADVELAFIKQAVLDLALVVNDLVKLIK
ncbi:MAG: hypothetical protein PWP69_926 [Enterococcus sp.]|uniref:hypothetical protein n=1 Tax=Enterococcus sp. TaxID=35783 RepID=UPI00258FDEE5|nr:hypothetical protein [Enterococcus sp.]MDK2844134.1 hypothetical protein [Enterococcus sp.]